MLTNIFDVYVGKDKIYHSKEKDILMGNQVLRKILVPLPEHWQGKTVYLRLTGTFNQYLGIYGVIYVGMYKDILAKIFNYEFDYIVIAFFFLLLSLVMLGVSFFVKETKQKKAIFALICFILCTAGWNIGEYDNIDLILFCSPYWAYLDSISVLFSPVFIFYFLEQFFTQGKWKILTRIWQLHLFYVLPYISCVFYNPALDKITICQFLSFYYSWKIIKFLFIIYAFLALVVIGNKLREKNDAEAKILLIGLAVLGISIAKIDYNYAHWGILFFIFSLNLMLGYRFLKNYNCLEKMSFELQEKNLLLANYRKKLINLIAERKKSLNNLLDSTGQGFLSFSDDLMVERDYSRACQKIFAQNIEKVKITDLLWPDNKEERDFLASILQKMLQEFDDKKQKKYLPLLPDKLLINGRNIDISYKIRKKKNGENIFMLILTDITENISLENILEQEKNNLRMVVKHIAHSTEWEKTLKTYQYFYEQQLSDILASSQALEAKVKHIFRLVHTLKGSFSQLEMINIAQHLHELESRILNLQIEQSNEKKICNFFLTQSWQEWLQQDIEIIEKLLGEEFLQQGEKIFIKKSDLLDLEEKMSASLDAAQYKLIWPQFLDLTRKGSSNNEK